MFWLNPIYVCIKNPCTLKKYLPIHRSASFSFALTALNPTKKQPNYEYKKWDRVVHIL